MGWIVYDRNYFVTNYFFSDYFLAGDRGFRGVPPTAPDRNGGWGTLSGPVERRIEFPLKWVSTSFS